MKKFLSLLLLCPLCCIMLRAQTKDIITRKNFPLLYALEKDPGALDAVKSDRQLRSLALDKAEALRAAASQEEAIRLCRLSEEESSLAAQRLAALSCRKEFRAIISGLRNKGVYYIHNSLPDKDFIREAWKMDVRGMNRIIDVYALGEKPYYAAIDSIDFKLDGGTYINRVRADVLSNAASFSEGGPFWALTLESALAWLDANGRWEAADFEPMDQGINKSAYSAIPGTKWEEFPYSVIVVLGCGPERYSESISPESRMRASFAARLYKQGKAPFLVVSGGRVHPFKTTRSEALEIKQYLIDYLGIPEEAIIAEPHARHTTTNLRNTVRIMMQQGIPMDKPALVTSGEYHIDYVCHESFISFGKEQMLVVPVSIGRRLDERTAEFMPLPSAAQVASADPLDP